MREVLLTSSALILAPGPYTHPTVPAERIGVWPVGAGIVE